MQTQKEERHRWRQLVCLRKGRRLDVREGENAWKRGEGGDLMLTWWALESSCGCKGFRGADREFHSHCLQWRGIPVSGSAWKLWLT